MIRERFDFSALDVTPGWDAAVERTLTQLEAVASRRANPLLIMQYWRRPILAAAALVILLCGTRLVREPKLEKNRTNAASLAAWALTGDQPTGGVIADLLTRTRP